MNFRCKMYKTILYYITFKLNQIYKTEIFEEEKYN